MADLEGAFDTVWREGAVYKLHEASIKNNLLSVFCSFLQDRFSRNLVNSYSSDWFLTDVGVPQGSLLSPLIFLVYTSDLTMEENIYSNMLQRDQELPPRESKYADDVEFWRVHSDIFQVIIDIQIAILNLQEWCAKWRISINTSKTNYMIFYSKKNTKSSPPQIPLTIDGDSLKVVSSQRVLGIIIDDNLSFTPHIENIVRKCKQAYSRLTRFPDMRPDLAVQLYKSYIRSKLEYGAVVWGHTIHTQKHLKLLDEAQRGALKLILRGMKSTPTDALESELNIVPIDLRLIELQRMEAAKLLQKDYAYIKKQMKNNN